MNLLDSRFRGNDKNGEVTTFYETIKDDNCEFCYLIKELRDWELLIPKFLNPLIPKLKKHNCLAISKSQINSKHPFQMTKTTLFGIL